MEIGNYAEVLIAFGNLSERNFQFLISLNTPDKFFFKPIALNHSELARFINELYRVGITGFFVHSFHVCFNCVF